MITIVKNELPSEGFDLLLKDAQSESYDFVASLAEEWASRQTRFDGPGEILCGYFDDGLLVAVGGLNLDPFIRQPDQPPGIGRIRKVYVRPAWRGQGIGQALMMTLIDEARKSFGSVRLRAENAGAARLYERLGFTGIRDPHATHILHFAT